MALQIWWYLNSNKHLVQHCQNKINNDDSNISVVDAEDIHTHLLKFVSDVKNNYADCGSNN